MYIANILKCRPPRNRDPLPEETAACMPYLREQIRAVSPNIIVCLGRVAARQLIDEIFTAGKDHGKWTARGRFLMMGVYHPSLLLRDPSRREDMLADLMEIKRQSEILKLAP